MRMRTLAVLVGVFRPAPRPAPSGGAPQLLLVRQHPTPVLTMRSPGAEGIRYGFEGGRVVKVRGTYDLFTSEMVGDPIWVKMRLGHWTSRDRLTWKRASTVAESSGEFEGKDRAHRCGRRCRSGTRATNAGTSSTSPTARLRATERASC